MDFCNRNERVLARLRALLEARRPVNIIFFVGILSRIFLSGDKLFCCIFA